mgnify:CR=1 FL=1
MSIPEAIILGIIQGITEWLPVSSSGHLALASYLFGIEPVGISLMLHLSSLFAVIIVLRKDILGIAKAGIKSIGEPNPESKLLFYIITATIPIAIIGLLFKDNIEAAFNSIRLVGIFLIITAIILWLTKYSKPNRDISLAGSIIIGLSQALAILPGISRSGATISAALCMGIDREKAARFSFLLFIPAIAGATILEYRTFAEVDLIPGIVAASVSFTLSLFVIRWLIGLVKKSRLHWFAPYCLVLGITAVLI